MASSDLRDLREQILANAKYMMFSSVDDSSSTSDAGTKLPTLNSVATLVTPNSSTTTTSAVTPDKLDVVVYGDGTQFTAVVMCGIKPVIEDDSSPNPESAVRKLLISTAELLNTVMPKLGSHQRNIHGGGVVDEDFLSRDLLEKKA